MTMHPPGRRTRDERGAFAVLFTLMIVMLVSVAALGIDLGNALSRKTDTQNQADFAAIDAGQEFPNGVAAGTAGATVPANIVTAVAGSFNNNQPEDDNSACWRDQSCVTSAQLTDCPATPTAACFANGEVRFVATGRLQVIAPQARVNFGFANVFGSSGTSVQSHATVGVFSVGPRVLPMFAVAGCDWGRQTLTDPAGPHADPVVPTLALGSQTNNNKLVAGGVILKDSTGTTVSNLAVASTGNSLVVNGSKWNNLTKFGFFKSEDTDATHIVDQGTFWAASDSTKAQLTKPYTKNSGGQIGLDIPNSVAASEGLWYLRAFDGTNWSAVAEAQPIRVGETLLECASGSASGNFGTLKLPRSGTPSSNDIPLNIAIGLQDPLSLHTHDWAKDTPSSSGLCSEPDHGAIESTGSGSTPLKPQTNCVDTDTGLTAEVATDGLITRSPQALLTGKPTHAGCAPDGSGNSRSVHISPTDYLINDDTLSCFLLPGKTLAQVADTGYLLSDGPAFDEDLLSSPRFAYVPVLKIQPATGGSQRYSIVDFRPAFITDESTASTDTFSDATTNNGVRVTTNKVDQLKVFFFSMNSLPHDGDVPLIDFLGVGKPVVHLVD